MSSLRELKNHLRSVQITGQLAGAMRTVATAKYSRISAVMTAGADYRSAMRDMLDRFGTSGALPVRSDSAGRDCFVVICGNRGLCGGYNSELLAYFFKLYRDAGQPMVITCGRMAAEYCRDKNISVEKAFELSDLPTYEQATGLTDFLCSLYSDGRANRITVVGQKFINMLRQTPHNLQFIPQAGDGSLESDILFVPDRASAEKKVIMTCLKGCMYSILLECAAGSQAATLMAMRSAYDNARQSSANLELQLNRRRQSEVTAGVIETSSNGKG